MQHNHAIPIIIITPPTDQREEIQNKPTGSYLATSYFNPLLRDEIKVEIGDSLVIKRAYRDGWSCGYNATADLHGFFPTACYAELNTLAPSPKLIPMSKNSSFDSRASFMYYDEPHAILSIDTNGM